MQSRPTTPASKLPLGTALTLLGAILLLGSPRAVLGDGHQDHHHVYLPRVDAAPVVDDDAYEQLQLGREVLCLLDAGGRLHCRDLGSGEPVPGLAGVFRHFSLGIAGICGVRGDGSIVCANDPYGAEPWSAPASRYRKVRVGFNSACGLRTDGGITCWPWYGDWEGIEEARAHEGPAGRYRDLAVTGSRVCGLTADNAIACTDWLEDEAPILRGPRLDIVQMALSPTGGDRTLLLRADGSVSWWDMASGAVLPGPTGAYRQISWRSYPACALTTQGNVRCWHGTDIAMRAPAGSYRSIAAGDGALCAVRGDGALRCWEWDTHGDLQVLPLP